jgi:hypothetical protein
MSAALIQRWRHVARNALKSRSHYKRLVDAIWGGEFDCPSCGVVTNNGYCTGCTHGTSGLMVARREVATAGQVACAFAFAVGMEAGAAARDIEKATAMARERMAAQDRLTQSLWTERQKSAELAAALVDYQRRWVVAQQERDELARTQADLLTVFRDLRPAMEANDEQPLVHHAWRIRRERDEARGEVLGLLRMLRERGVVLP